MCGRFAIDVEPLKIKKQFHIENRDSPLLHNFNVALRKRFSVTADKSQQLHLTPVRWGLIPWYEAIKGVDKPRMHFNARSESIGEKTTFKYAFAKRRCLVLISGFFEWKIDEDNNHLPFFVKRHDGKLIAVAAIWESINNEDTNALSQRCLLKAKACTILSIIHERMPLILKDNQIKDWLYKEHLKQDDVELLSNEKYPLIFDFYQVTAKVNKSTYKNKDTIIPKASTPIISR